MYDFKLVQNNFVAYKLIKVLDFQLFLRYSILCQWKELDNFAFIAKEHKLIIVLTGKLSNEMTVLSINLFNMIKDYESNS